MPLINKRFYTKEDLNAMQQPIDPKTGRVNEKFDELYKHKTKNPFWATERDPSKARKEYFKVKEEYDRYSDEMSVRTKLKYEEYLAKKRKEL